MSASSILASNPLSYPPNPFLLNPVPNSLPLTLSSHISSVSTVTAAGTLASPQLATGLVIQGVTGGTGDIVLPTAQAIVGQFPTLGVGDTLFVPVYNLVTATGGITVTSGTGGTGTKTIANYYGTGAAGVTTSGLSNQQGLVLKFTSVSPATSAAYTLY